MTGGVVHLRVDLGPGPDGDAAELDEEARQLERELLELDVEDVGRLAEGAPPTGARAVEAALVGTVVVTATKDVVAAVMRTLVLWVRRRPNRSVKLTIGDDSIELSDVSADDQRRLVDSFLARHAAS